MNVLYYSLGVLLIFATKLFVNNKADQPIDKWKRIFEIPADISLLSFMMGIAGTASLTTYTRSNQIVLLVLIFLGMPSVALYKQNCRTISDMGGTTQFDNIGGAILAFVGNCLIAGLAIYLSYTFLGADA